MPCPVLDVDDGALGAALNHPALDRADIARIKRVCKRFDGLAKHRRVVLGPRTPLEAALRGGGVEALDAAAASDEDVLAALDRLPPERIARLRWLRVRLGSWRNPTAALPAGLPDDARVELVEMTNPRSLDPRVVVLRTRLRDDDDYKDEAGAGFKAACRRLAALGERGGPCATLDALEIDIVVTSSIAAVEALAGSGLRAKSVVVSLPGPRAAPAAWMERLAAAVTTLATEALAVRDIDDGDGFLKCIARRFRAPALTTDVNIGVIAAVESRFAELRGAGAVAALDLTVAVIDAGDAADGASLARMVATGAITTLCIIHPNAPSVHPVLRRAPALEKLTLRGVVCLRDVVTVLAGATMPVLVELRLEMVPCYFLRHVNAALDPMGSRREIEADLGAICDIGALVQAMPRARVITLVNAHGAVAAKLGGSLCGLVRFRFL